MTTSSQLIEALAKLEHDQWMDWAKNLLEKEPALSQARKDRWAAFMVPYDRLDEAAKDMDRIWAAKVVELIQNHYTMPKELQHILVLERDMLTKVVDALQSELENCRGERDAVEEQRQNLEQRLGELHGIVKDFFAAQLDSKPKLD